MPSHYLNQCWKIVNSKLRNKLQWNLKWNSYIFIRENAFELTIQTKNYAHGLRSVTCLAVVNSLRPSDANMHQYTRPSLVQIMACCLFGVKPLSEPMVGCPLGTNFSGVLIAIQRSPFYKLHLKMSSAKCQWFCLCLNVLSNCRFTHIFQGTSRVHGPQLYDCEATLVEKG